MEEKKKVDVSLHNSKVEIQFKHILELYNPLFAKMIFDKSGTAFILNVGKVLEDKIQEKITYNTEIFYTGHDEKNIYDRNYVGDITFSHYYLKRELNINSISVYDDWQNGGIGRAILKTIEKFARANNCNQMSLLCQKRMATHKETGKIFNVNHYIYEKEGYKNILNYQNSDCEYIPMEKKLTKIEEIKE